MPWIVRQKNRLLWFPGMMPEKICGRWSAADCGDGVEISAPPGVEVKSEDTPVESDGLTRDRIEGFKKNTKRRI